MWAKRAASTGDAARAPASTSAPTQASAQMSAALTSTSNSRFAPRRSAQPAATAATSTAKPIAAHTATSASTPSSVFAPRRSAAAPSAATISTPSSAVPLRSPPVSTSSSSVFAPRRAAAATSVNSSSTHLVPNASVRTQSASPRAATAANTKGNDDDSDVQWLLRVAERKKKKKASAKPSAVATSTNSIAAVASSKSTHASTTGTKKRQLSTSAGITATVDGTSATPAPATHTADANEPSTQRTNKKPKTATSVVTSWKQRQQMWRRPAPPSSTAQQQTHEQAARESERLETFDHVFLEVFGRAQHERAIAAVGAEQYAPGALAASGSTSGSASGSTSGSVSGSVIPAGDTNSAITSASATNSAAESATKSNNSDGSQPWGFATSSAVRIDDFDVPATDTSGTQVVTFGTTGEFARWKATNATHTVSDNFVKLHMRKRVRGSTGRAKKRPAYLRTRFDPVDTDERGSADTKNDAFMDPIAVRAATSSSSTNTFDPSGSGASGSVNDGIDFIEECLEVLARVEAQRASDTSTSTGDDSAMIPPTISLSVSDEQLPRCHHALVCTRISVKKKSVNHGRVFFACPLRFDEGRCDFFLWEDNHAQLALATLLAVPGINGITDTDTDTESYVPLDLTKPMDKQTEALVTNLRLVFGHAAFRAGQQWAITRVFAQRSTLLVLPTGAGKSLCYQYPALFLPGVTLVISPLISLMNDQFANLPQVLKSRAVCLTSGTSSTKTAYATFVRDLLSGKLKLVFLSPERAVSNGFQQLISQIRSRLSLVCVDEAHCISEWSHHFRPSYLRLATVFQYAQCVLAITATASTRVIADILAQLRSGGNRRDTRAICEVDTKLRTVGTEQVSSTGPELSSASPELPSTGTDTPFDTKLRPNNTDDTEDTDDSDMVLQMPWQRSNLALQVRRVQSNDERIEHLVHFLSTTKLTGGIIMYVHQQRQAEDMAAVLKDQLPGSAWQRKIAFFHARMDADTKEKVRTGFLSGRVRVVIATIAFGMGIDKQNVRCVIHFHMPSSVENYLQQIGRAGRDGKRALGLLYLLPNDVQTFRSLAFSNAFHIDQLRRLVKQLVFAGTNMEDIGISSDDTKDDAATQREHIVAVRTSGTDGTTAACEQLHVSLDVEWLELFLDMKAATIETFLTLLALRTTAGSKNSSGTGDTDGIDTNLETPLEMQLLPSSMAMCVLHVVERKFRDASDSSILKRIVYALQKSQLQTQSQPQLHGRVTIETNGYLTMLVVEFHVREMAEQLFGPELRAAATFATSDTPLVGTNTQQSISSTCERRLLQHVRAMQQDGQIQRFTLERLAFHVALQWRQALDESQRSALVDAWTHALYAKHVRLEAMEVDRLTRLYGALYAASLPCKRIRTNTQHIGISTKRKSTNDTADNDSDDDDVVAKAQVLEDRLVAYFADDRVTRADEQLMKTLLAPLTPSVIEAIEHDVRSLVALAVSDEPDPDGDNDTFEPFSSAYTRKGSKSTMNKNKNKPQSASTKQAQRARQQQIARTQWTCCSVAKLFHGLASPCFPILKWRDHASWKKYDAYAFEHLVRIADKVLNEDGRSDINGDANGDGQQQQ